jgi:hypothetical protein
MTSVALQNARELAGLSRSAAHGLWDYVRRGEADMDSWM